MAWGGFMGGLGVPWGVSSRMWGWGCAVGCGVPCGMWGALWDAGWDVGCPVGHGVPCRIWGAVRDYRMAWVGRKLKNHLDPTPPKV